MVGFSRVAQAAGFERAIGFDMGGTSTDVSRFDGRYELEYETEKAGVRVVAPMLAIETVAAGGGSICGFDGVKLVVGPDSAGADPGPACYGRGGPLAVTDVNFYLGKILPERFPFPLDRAAVETRLRRTRRRRSPTPPGKRYSPLELGEGFVRVANANMVKAIRSISVAKGCDPRDYVLVAFGGAAGSMPVPWPRELGIAADAAPSRCRPARAPTASAWPTSSRHRRGRRLSTAISRSAVTELEPLFAQLDRRSRATKCWPKELPAERIEIAPLARPALSGRRRLSDDSRAGRRRTMPRPIAARASSSCMAIGIADRPLEIVAARVEVVGRTADAADAGRASSPPDEPEPERIVDGLVRRPRRAQTQVF